jgi:hypothetical protein
MTNASNPTNSAAATGTRPFWIRVGISVFFGTLAIAMCASWARSYTWRDRVTIVAPFAFDVSGDSVQGRLYLHQRQKGLTKSIWWEVYDVARYSTSSRYNNTIGFGWNDWLICLPYWFLSLVAIVLATTPLVIHRFSLRALLIAVTLVAVVLGLAVWAGR